MKGCIGKKLVSLGLSLALCATAVPMVSITSSAAGKKATPKVATGENHTVVLKADGTVWATGSNEYGQLGVGQTSDNLVKTATFMQCKYGENNDNIEDATDIACGWYHTAVIRDDGKLWQCGYNNRGQLGTGNRTSSNSFVQSYYKNDAEENEAIEDATAVACGWYHTAVIRDSGKLWQCGHNQYGQIGMGKKTATPVTSFVQSYYGNGDEENEENKAIEDAIAVACGYCHTAVIREDKTIWQCGYNGSEQLGVGYSCNCSVIFIKSTDMFKEIKDAKEIFCGRGYTTVLCENGEFLYCGGGIDMGDLDGTLGQFMTPKDSSRNVIADAKMIACGYSHAAVIRSDNTLWVSGSNGGGQLGTGDTVSLKALTPVKDANGETTTITDVKAMAAYNNTLLIKSNSDGGLELWGTGKNDNGQLGLGEDNPDAYTDQTRLIKIMDLGTEEVPTSATGDILTKVGQFVDHNVTGVGEFVNVIDVEITWGALTYSYNATWNSADQKWNEGDWKPSGNNADMIEVTNNSSAAYNVSLAFTVDNAYAASSASGTAVKGIFFKKEDSSGQVVEKDLTDNILKLTTTAEAKKDTVYLKLTGMSDKITGLENDLTDKTVGTVTATLQNPTTT